MQAKTILRNESGKVYGVEFKCKCGCFVVSYLADTSCDNCGREYNAMGQELAPRSQWNELEDY
jgi:acetoacetate decarboxylase